MKLQTVTHLCLLLFLLGSTQRALGEDPDSLRVLFLGNSYTFYNDLPQLTADLASSAGKVLQTSQNTPGGYTLTGHSNNATTLQLIAIGNFDCVILQEQSQMPVIEYWRETNMYPAVRVLNDLIGNVGSSTMMFMTWGRELGGQQCMGEYCSPEFRNFVEMQDALSLAFHHIADEVGAAVSPAGDAWALALQTEPGLALWSTDQSHPSLEGSYLAACVFYTTLFDASPVGLSFYGGLSRERAEFYQQIAYDLHDTSLGNQTQPARLSFMKAYPNPFNPSTTIEYTLETGGDVGIRVFDLGGHEVGELEEGVKLAGSYSVDWKPEDLPSGLYFVEVKSLQERHILKISYLK